jgi:predicted O-methyltransferase YrrM
MTVTERLFLYTITRALRPERVLEIGSRHGGSASIMAAAMEDVGCGRIVGVDPAPKITVPQRHFFGRFDLIEAPSPDALPEARRRSGAPFDLALIDGLHIYDQARRDLAGTLPLMQQGAYILLHDAFHFGLSEAIRQELERNSGVQDCGYVCAKPAMKVGVLAYGGIRMLRVGRSRVVSPEPILRHAYDAAGLPAPPRDAELLNHDAWYCRVIHPCPRCAAAQARLAPAAQHAATGDEHAVHCGA